MAEKKKRYGLTRLSKEENRRLKERTEDKVTLAQARGNYWKHYRDKRDEDKEETAEAWERLKESIIALGDETINQHGEIKGMKGIGCNDGMTDENNEIDAGHEIQDDRDSDKQLVNYLKGDGPIGVGEEGDDELVGVRDEMDKQTDQHEGHEARDVGGGVQDDQQDLLEALCAGLL